MFAEREEGAGHGGRAEGKGEAGGRFKVLEGSSWAVGLVPRSQGHDPNFLSPSRLPPPRSSVTRATASSNSPLLLPALLLSFFLL